MAIFDSSELQNLYKRVPTPNNGEVTIIGGSDLFHGAPLLSLTAASRIVDMVYFSSPEPSLREVALHLKSQLFSFIWVPWEEVGDYILKSDSVLVGPGMKRYRKELNSSSLVVRSYDQDGQKTRDIVKSLLGQFPDKRWVIDGGALQTMDPDWIPKGSILTPNSKELEIIFGIEKDGDFKISEVQEKAKHYDCTIVCKGPVAYVCTPEEVIEVHGGNNGLTKGGTGDVLAGVVAGLYAKNPSLLAATAASWAVKSAADSLQERVGTVYNSDDLAAGVAETLGKYLI